MYGFACVGAAQDAAATHSTDEAQTDGFAADIVDVAQACGAGLGHVLHHATHRETTIVCIDEDVVGAHRQDCFHLSLVEAA